MNERADGPQTLKSVWFMNLPSGNCPLITWKSLGFFCEDEKIYSNYSINIVRNSLMDSKAIFCGTLEHPKNQFE